MKIKLVTANEGEVIVNAGMRIRILEDGLNTQHRLGITEVKLAPGTPGPPQHLHRTHEETFYVVRGIVRFISGTQHLDVTAGALVTAPIGAPHTFANPTTDQEAVLLVTYTPDRYINYFREMAALSKHTEGIGEETYLNLMSGYDTEPFRANHN